MTSAHLTFTNLLKDLLLIVFVSYLIIHLDSCLTGSRIVDLVLFPILTAAVVRCSQSMTGLTWLPADEGFHVVRQSATADVFIQHLTQTEDVNEEMTENELTAFADWCKPTLSPQTEASTVEVTQVENLLSVTKGETVILFYFDL